MLWQQGYADWLDHKYIYSKVERGEILEIKPSKLSSMEMNVFFIKKNRIVNNNGYEVSRSKKFEYLDLLFKR